MMFFKISTRMWNKIEIDVLKTAKQKRDPIFFTTQFFFSM